MVAYVHTLTRTMGNQKVICNLRKIRQLFGECVMVVTHYERRLHRHRHSVSWSNGILVKRSLNSNAFLYHVYLFIPHTQIRKQFQLPHSPDENFLMTYKLLIITDFFTPHLSFIYQKQQIKIWVYFLMGLTWENVSIIIFCCFCNIMYIFCAWICLNTEIQIQHL